MIKQTFIVSVLSFFFTLNVPDDSRFESGGYLSLSIKMLGARN